MEEENNELLQGLLEEEQKKDELKEKMKEDEKEAEEEAYYENLPVDGLSTAYPEKQNVHTFLHNVATAKDTTKTGYLNEEELGEVALTLRSCKELSLISATIMSNPYFTEYFLGESEIVTSTSLSRQAKLLELAIREKKEIADVTKPKTENKSWFKKKDGSKTDLD